MEVFSFNKLDRNSGSRLNANAIRNFLHFGYFLGSESPFEGIECNIINPKFNAFLDFKGTPENNNAPPYSLEEYYKKASVIWDEIFDNIVEESSDLIVPISGGLDSRAVLAAVSERLKSESIHTYTFGSKGSLDFDIGNTVAGKLNTKHRAYDLEKSNFFERLPLLKKHLNLGADLFTSPPLKEMNEDFAGGTILTGFMGDPSVGSHLPDTDVVRKFGSSFLLHKENYTGIMGFADQIVGCSEVLEEASNKYGLNLTDPRKIELWDIVNRQRRYVTSQVFWGPYDYQIPFIDARWLKFCETLPFEYRLNQEFYKYFLFRKYKKIFSLPTKNMQGQGLNRSKLNQAKYFTQKVRNKLFKKRKIKRNLNYCDFNEMIRENSELRGACVYYLSSLAKYELFDSFMIDNYWNGFLCGKQDYRPITLLVSLGIILEALSENY